MLYYAKLEDSKVVDLLKVGNNLAEESVGREYLQQTYGGVWVMCSEDPKFRNGMPSLGDTFVEYLDIFIKPKPYPSWVFNGKTYDPPSPKPKYPCRWNEEQRVWEVDPNIPVDE